MFGEDIRQEVVEFFKYGFADEVAEEDDELDEIFLNLRYGLGDGAADAWLLKLLAMLWIVVVEFVVRLVILLVPQPEVLEYGLF